jgi:hypothetical protein
LSVKSSPISRAGTLTWDRSSRVTHAEALEFFRGCLGDLVDDGD